MPCQFQQVSPIPYHSGNGDKKKEYGLGAKANAALVTVPAACGVLAHMGPALAHGTLAQDS